MPPRPVDIDAYSYVPTARSKAAAARKTNPSRVADTPSLCHDLPTDVLLHIHDRLGPIGRFAFAAVIKASCEDDVIKPCPYASWILLPGKTTETLELVSITDGRGLIVPAPNPALRGHLVVGSSGVRISTVRKVVLLASPSPGSYTAMLIMHQTISAPAFATAEDPAWRLAPSPDGGRLMVVLKYLTITRERQTVKEEGQERSGDVEFRYGQDRWSCSFKVHVLGDNRQWKEVTDIGDVALFVGVNNSLCLPTTEWPQIKAGCVYFTGDGLGQGAIHRSYGIQNDPGDLRAVGMYNLKDGRACFLLLPQAGYMVSHTFHAQQCVQRKKMDDQQTMG
uniref:KIB1-4 beta-propeller domain-containing protein n=1 Tax=Aegilops tauschii TaxID=37682 RepID=M8BLI9_AEGTA